MTLFPIAADGQTQAPAAAVLDVAVDVIAANVALYGRRGYVEPWIGYLAVDDSGQIVGSCGFTGPPVAGEVELAYFSFPGFEGRGIATAMATALMRLAQPAADTSGIRLSPTPCPKWGRRPPSCASWVSAAPDRSHIQRTAPCGNGCGIEGGLGIARPGVALGRGAGSHEIYGNRRRSPLPCTG